MKVAGTMDWVGLIINVVAIFVGFFVYIGIYHSPLAKKLDRFQYPVLLAVIILICLIGGLLRAIFAV